MARIILDVPFVTQLGFGDPANLKYDHSGCWYAMACMIGGFFEQGPRLGVPSLYQAGYGSLADGRATHGHRLLHPGTPDEEAFFRNEDLERLAQPASRRWNADDLAMALRKFGPLGFYWFKTANGATYGHACVLIGVTDRTVVFHDPENAPRATMPLAEFNRLLLWDCPTVMVRRRGPAFQGTPSLTAFTPVITKPKPGLPAQRKGPGFFGGAGRPG